MRGLGWLVMLLMLGLVVFGSAATVEGWTDGLYDGKPDGTQEAVNFLSGAIDLNAAIHSAPVAPAGSVQSL